MYELTLESGFSAAHSLRGYQGPCARLHGHNYRVLVLLSGEELDQAGMLMDFRQLRQVVGRACDELDHQHLNELAAFSQDNPTAENIARHLFRRITSELAGLALPAGLRLRRVTVYESPTAAASYGENG